LKINIWNSHEPDGTARRGVLKTLKTQYSIQPASKASRAPEDSHPRNNAREIMMELNNLTGLHEVKKLIREIYAFVEIQKRRQKERLATEPLVLHMIFKGNPGTGKTTVARILGKLMKEVGVLPRGHLIEVERADLVGEFIGHTAQKTREQIKKALGGILFIDEAYSLARGGEKDFGKEAIDALVKGMEDHRDNLILILAGYQEEMDWFVEINPGMRSRFPVHISFPDYTTGELLDIADLMLQQKQYSLSNGAREELRYSIEKKHKRHEHSGNARLVRNMIERAIRRQAVRLLEQKGDLSREDLMLIIREDMEGFRKE
jgi:stage V sporulation protein K